MMNLVILKRPKGLLSAKKSLAAVKVREWATRLPEAMTVS